MYVGEKEKLAIGTLQMGVCEHFQIDYMTSQDTYYSHSGEGCVYQWSTVASCSWRSSLHFTHTAVRGLPLIVIQMCKMGGNVGAPLLASTLAGGAAGMFLQQ